MSDTETSKSDVAEYSIMRESKAQLAKRIA